MLDERFTVRTALAAGVTREQLRGPRWRAPFYGVRVDASSPSTVAANCRALALALPDNAVFTGITAARLQGWWLPARVESWPIEVVVAPNQLVKRPGVRCRRSIVGDDEVATYEGLRLTSAVRTLGDLACDWSLVDLVVMADAALHLGSCSADSLAAFGERAAGRGVRALRRAIRLADGLSESAMETLMRLSIVLSKLPAPIVQAVLRDVEGGFLARADLLTADGHSVFEFDGAGHNEPARHASDVEARRLSRGGGAMRLRRTLRAHGFEVYPYTAGDVFLRSHHIVRDYQHALGLPGDPAAAEHWLREWERSSFAGYRRLSR